MYKSTLRVSVIHGVACCLMVMAGTFVQADSCKNPFFAMDTGTRDSKHETPEAQAKMLKELGYSGIGWSPTMCRGRWRRSMQKG